MTLDLRHHDKKSRDAVAAFWQHRAQAKAKQVDRGKSDQGERAGVTAGKNMDGFLSLVIDTVKANGLKKAEIHQKRAVVTLPGHFRPTKLWDLLVMDQGELIVAIELKSQVGPSFGNNFNNRAEEAIGTAMDFWTAYREGALGAQVRPFVVTLPLENESLAECFNTGKERWNDEDGKVALHAGVQAGSGTAGAIGAEHGGGFARSGHC